MKRFNLIFDKSIFSLRTSSFARPFIIGGLLLITLLGFLSQGTVSEFVFLLYGLVIVYTAYLFGMKPGHWMMGISFVLNIVSQYHNIIKEYQVGLVDKIVIERFLIVVLFFSGVLLFAKYLILEREAKERLIKSMQECLDTSRKLAAANASINELYVSTIKALALAIEAKDPYTKGHSERVTKYATAIARELHLSEEEIKFITYASILHDIGKIGVDESILKKPGLLTAEEYDQIKKHPEIGSSIISTVKFLKPAIPIVLHHHEFYDGTGYPSGMKGADIPIGARILAMVDSYDAMIYDRPYRKGLSREEAFEQISSGAGTQFDPYLVEIFRKVLDNEKAGKTLPVKVKNFS